MYPLYIPTLPTHFMYPLYIPTMSRGYFRIVTIPDNTQIFLSLPPDLAICLAYTKNSAL